MGESDGRALFVLVRKGWPWKPDMTIPADTFLSIDQAMKAFRPWISAELLKSQFRWLIAESKSRQVKKAEVLRRVLTAWVDNHPEECLTKPQLFNIMRAATGESIEQWGGSAPKTR
jgi:hypothetical protein